MDRRKPEFSQVQQPFSLSHFVKKRREELEYSLRDLAEKSGLSKSYLSRIENGEAGSLTLEALDGLAKGLRVPFETILRAAKGLPPVEEEAKQLANEALFDGLRRSTLKPEQKAALETLIESMLRQADAEDAAKGK